MRLVKVSSDVLSEMERIAIIDSRSEGCSVGRDRSFDPRIRLADLEVSKTHCHLFFLQSGETNEFGFAISDIGSTHGTFVLSNSTLEEEDLSSLPTSSFQRLSPSKKASSPFFLNHLDLIKVGNTLFRVHIHESWSCKDCSLNSEGTDEIQLHQPSSQQNSKVAEPSSSNQIDQSNNYQDQRRFGDRKLDSEAHRRDEMKDLKAKWGGKQNGNAGSGNYTDRAAVRRSKNGNLPSTLTSASNSASKTFSTGPLSRTSVSPPDSTPAPLDSSNKGYRLLAQMTGESGGKGRLGKELVQGNQMGSSGLGYRQLEVLGEEESRKKRKKKQAPRQNEPSYIYSAQVKKSARRRYEEIEQ